MLLHFYVISLGFAMNIKVLYPLGFLAITGGIAAQLMTPPVQSQQKGKDVQITLVSYAVTRSAYEKIIPKFVAKWQKEKGQKVTFKQSYGGSGSQTRAVIDGLDADVVQLALASDVDKIQKAGLINAGWQNEVPNNGIVTKSVIALVTRAGNPKKVKDWRDLGRPEVKTVTANPKTSGVARWNFLGLWGSVTQTGGSEAKAREFTTKVYNNVPVLPKDAREATDVFYKQGQGDVLLNYENEILLAKSKGENEPFIIPPVNISIDAPVAVVDKNTAKKGTTEVATAFAKFLFTPEAQEEFAKTGFRPVNSAVASKYASKFPKVPKLYTVSAFGGWGQVQDKFFKDGGIFDQVFKAK